MLQGNDAFLDRSETLISVDKRLGYLTFTWQPAYKNENSKFRPVKLHTKTDLVSHPAQSIHTTLCSMVDIIASDTLILNPYKSYLIEV